MAPAAELSLESLVAEVADEFMQRLRRGESPDVEDYAARYPQHATALKQVLAALTLMRDPTTAFAGDDVSHLAASREPRPGLLGDFRILREIGRGGMGVVYEAQQISLNRRVALKVLPYAAMLDARQLKRFQNEAQAAASLHHTNIVPVHAVGCERGVHYYAMQFIEGRTLERVIADLRQVGHVSNVPLQMKARHVENVPHDNAPSAEDSITLDPSAADTVPAVQAALSTHRSVRTSDFFRNVAELAIQVAEALHYAHEEGVTHRDIKPSNLILDERGRVWITDFGLAHMETAGTLTMTGDLLGTLRYMSPEQALAKRASIDHRTDIYSLGVTLYELLTLRPAFEGDDRQELLRKIAGEDPPAPRRLGKAVPAELETIVLKAIEKNPSDRYATAQELADDLERFLEDRPIQARRPTLLQRARKWSRRHQPIVWSAAVCLVVIVAAVAGSIGWIVRDRVERWAATEQKLNLALDEATHLQAQAKWPQALEAVKRAEGIFANARNEALRKRIAELRKDLEMVLRLEAIRLPRARDGREGPYDNAWADESYGEAFREYGIDVEALGPVEAAKRIRERSIASELTVAVDDWADKRRHANKAGWQRLITVARAADPDEWRNRVRDALRQRDKAALTELARSPELSSQPLQTLSLLAGAIQGSEACEAVLRQAQRKYPNDFWINFQLAWALIDREQPQFDEGVRFYTAAVSLRPQNAPAQYFLARALHGQGKLEEALAVYGRAVDLQPDLAGPPCELAGHIFNVATALREQGKLDEALAAYHKAAEYSKIAELKPEFASDLCDFAYDLWKRNKLDEALTAFRKAAEVKPELANHLCDFAEELSKRGRLDDAFALYRRAIELRPDDEGSHFRFGRAVRAHNLDDAIAAFRNVVELKPDHVFAHFYLAECLRSRGELEEAISACRRTIDLKPDFAGAHNLLGGCLHSHGKLEEAIAAYGQAIELKPDYVDARLALGRALRAHGMLEECISQYRKAIEIAPDHAHAHNHLGVALRAQGGKLKEAIASFRRAAELKPDHVDFRTNLGRALRDQGSLTEAVEEFRHAIGLKPDDVEAAQWVKECERLIEMDAHEAAGKQSFADAGERLLYGAHCFRTRRLDQSARHFEEALADNSPGAADLVSRYRYNAACAAALAGIGEGDDTSSLTEAQLARRRGQARDWIRACLQESARVLESKDQDAPAKTVSRFEHWLRDPDLRGIRDQEYIAKLVPDERESCIRLWNEVRELLARARTKK
jgi:serine/threonine protein kinase/Flp pilus assembly protein TadD